MKHRLQLTGASLKVLACAAMFADHAVKVLPAGRVTYLILSSVIGRIAFPVFCFLLTEGFFRTKDRGRYLLRMVLFAALSEVPFDLAIYQIFWYPRYQNTLWSLSLGLLMFCCLHRIEQFRDMQAGASWIARGAVIGGFCAAAHALHVDYGARGLLCLAVLYCLWSLHYAVPEEAREKTQLSVGFPAFWAAVWGCVCLNLKKFSNPGAFLAAILLYFYNGERGRVRSKYLFYIFYPAHLLLLCALRAVL